MPARLALESNDWRQRRRLNPQVWQLKVEPGGLKTGSVSDCMPGATESERNASSATDTMSSGDSVTRTGDSVARWKEKKLGRATVSPVESGSHVGQALDPFGSNEAKASAAYLLF